jgi:hypothetical protein
MNEWITDWTNKQTNKQTNKLTNRQTKKKTQLNSTQHIFIIQTGIDTAIELKSHLRKDKTSKDNNKNKFKSKMDNIILDKNK